MVNCQIENDAAADRAAHHHRPVQLQRLAEGADGLRVARGRELILCAIPACRRVRFAVPGHVEGDHPEIPGKLAIRKQMPPLPSIGAGGVQADQRNARAAFLEIDTVHLAVDVDVHVAADDRFYHAVHDTTVAKWRGSASTSLKYC